MAIYEKDTNFTDADTWTKIAVTEAGKTLKFDFIITNAHDDEAVIEIGVCASDATPVAGTEIITETLKKDGSLSGSDAIGSLRAMYIRSDKTDTRVRCVGSIYAN